MLSKRILKIEETRHLLNQPLDESVARIEEIIGLLASFRGVSTLKIDGGSTIAKWLDAQGAIKFSAEFESGFPLMCSQAVVSLWSVAESMAQDTAIRWNHAFPTKLDADAKLKFDYQDVVSADPFRISEIAVEQLLKSKLIGTDRFVQLLKDVGLPLPKIESDDKRSFLELHQVRNVIVHKNGRADDWFCQTCTWLSAKPGQKITVNLDDVTRYSKAVRAFIMAITKGVEAEINLLAEQETPDEAGV